MFILIKTEQTIADKRKSKCTLIASPHREQRTDGDKWNQYGWNYVGAAARQSVVKFSPTSKKYFKRAKFPHTGQGLFETAFLIYQGCEFFIVVRSFSSKTEAAALVR